MAGVASGIEMGDVWYSEDGITWHELKSTTGNWPEGTRHAQSSTVFNDALWYMCGIATNNAWKIINTQTFSEIEHSLEIQPDYSLYPNPANNKIVIESLQKNPIGYYIIYNATGAQIATGSCFDITSEIDISSYNSGLYYIQLLNSYSTLAFIKN
jgi:hypothetical protein